MTSVFSPMLRLIRTAAAAALLSASGAQADNAQYSLNLTGIATGTAYTVSVQVGSADDSGSGSSSSNTFRLIADTGSANDAVLGSGCCGDDATVTYSCEDSSTCSATSSTTSLTFAGATIEGEFVTDKWASSDSEFATVSKEFLVIEDQTSFYTTTYDGITGLGYSALTVPTSDPPTSFLENLVDAASTTDAFGMLLCGTMQPLLGSNDSTLSTYHSGQLVIGGSEGVNGESYYTGTMLNTPIIEKSWYMVTVSDIGFDGESLGLDCTEYNDPEAIIDSGTSNLAFPSSIYSALMTKIESATQELISDFDSSYFDSSTSCCNEDYCDPTSTSAALLKLPSIYITLAHDDGTSSTSKHLTVEIPPEYYWRPEMNGDSQDTPCRALGISEGSAIVLGDVFMDGLYAYHDRESNLIGLAVADNCPNGVTSTKTVTESSSTDDWCSCFTSSQKSSSILVSYFPWGSGCFFMMWWMYLVIASLVVVIICCIVLFQWHRINQRTKKLKKELEDQARLASAATSAGSTSSQPSVAAAAAAGSTQEKKKVPQQQQPLLPVQAPPPPAPAAAAVAAPAKHAEPDDAHYVRMSSPRSMHSDSSSIALLSPPRDSTDSPINLQSHAAALGGPRRRSSSATRRYRHQTSAEL